MNKIIYNPFHRIAGKEALGIGLLVIIATSILAHYGGVTFSDIIGVKMGVSNRSVVKLLAQNIGHWFIFSSILYLFGIFSGKSHTRAVDVYGTQAFARIPYLLLTIISLIGINGTLRKITENINTEGPNSEIMSDIPIFSIVILTAFALFVVAIAIWYIALMYNAFKVSTNIKGEKTAFLFIVAILLSMVVSYFYRVHLISLIP